MNIFRQLRLDDWLYFYLICITVKVLQSIFAVTFGSLIAHSPGRDFFMQLPEILQNSHC